MVVAVVVAVVVWGLGLWSFCSSRLHPLSWSRFGRGIYTAPTFEIATGKMECDVCKMMIHNTKPSVKVCACFVCVRARARALCLASCGCCRHCVR